jgi:hypothetical protein
MPKLFKTDIESEANLKVFVTDIRSDSDAVIHETENAWDAGVPLVWCYTDIPSEADRIVYFADSQWNADIVVFKTDIASDVEWINDGKAGVL